MLKLLWKLVRKEESTYSDEDRLIKARERSLSAKSLSENEFLQTVFEEMSVGYMEVLGSVDPVDVKRRDDIHSRLVGLREFRDYVNSAIEEEAVVLQQIEQKELAMKALH